MAGISVAPFVTKLDIDPDTVISALRDAGLAHITVVGIDTEGELYFASSTDDGMMVLLHLQLAIKQLLENT